jgi:gamma-glutamylaminecyclotransferase
VSRRKQHLVFVYGTLMRDESNHGLLATARFVAEACTKPCFEFFDLGHFPAMSAGGQTVVRGEIYAVDEATLGRLDRLEGHPTLYQRTQIRLDGGQEVETYLMDSARMRGRVVIASGDWRTHRAQVRGVGTTDESCDGATGR